MNKRVAAVGIGVVAVIAIGAGFFLRSGKSGGGPGGGQGAPGGMQQEASYTIVKATPPYIGDVSVTNDLTGTVEAADVVYIYSKASGDVTAVHVKAGDIVEQGQVLCEINTEMVESAKNSLDSAEVSYNEAQSTLGRMQILYNGGNLSAQEYEQYQNKVKSARLQYESAKINYDKQVEYSTVTAPIGGRIESCDIDVYDHVSQSAQLCVIAGEGESRITFYVTQRMVKNLAQGDELEVIRNGASYQGRISELSTMVDADTGLFKVKAELENTDEIAIGSTVKIRLVTDRARQAMLVPVDAIYYSGGDGYLYLYKDGVAKVAPVEVGLYDSESAQILSGISPEDMVVSTWSSNLYEGARVRLISELEEEDAPQGGQDGSGRGSGDGQDASEGARGKGPGAHGGQPPQGQ